MLYKDNENWMCQLWIYLFDSIDTTINTHWIFNKNIQKAIYQVLYKIVKDSHYRNCAVNVSTLKIVYKEQFGEGAFLDIDLITDLQPGVTRNTNNQGHKIISICGEFLPECNGFAVDKYFHYLFLQICFNLTFQLR